MKAEDLDNIEQAANLGLCHPGDTKRLVCEVRLARGQAECEAEMKNLVVMCVLDAFRHAGGEDVWDWTVEHIRKEALATAGVAAEGLKVLKEIDDAPMVSEGDGTSRLCQALYGRDATPMDWLGGSEARMLRDGAERIRKGREACLAVLAYAERALLKGVLYDDMVKKAVEALDERDREKLGW